MSLTVVPNEDGTINISTPGSEEVVYDLDDINRCGLSESEKRFLRSQLRHAVPWPTICSVPRDK
ncbi:MAG TPA: hypothetical protein VNS88_00520 [Nitrospiraceae bacterium]|nr:hypothetical protein [Nitrospiraceae bacterium]